MSSMWSVAITADMSARELSGWIEKSVLETSAGSYSSSIGSLIVVANFKAARNASFSNLWTSVIPWARSRQVRTEGPQSS